MAPSVPLHQLGKNGPKVPALGFGLMGLSYQVYGAIESDEERFKILDKAVEMGCTFWDTSDLYGDSEELLGKWFKRTGKRDQIFLASKFGYAGQDEQGNYKMDSSGPYCKKACDASLNRMGTDHIDLYYMHHVNHDTPIEETMRALSELKAEGKIKYIGLSMISSNTLRRAVKIDRVDAVQVEYSVFAKDIEGLSGTHILNTCRGFGVAIVTSSPLGRGMLTADFGTKDAFQDVRGKVMPRFQKENRNKNAEIVHKFSEFADKKGCTVPQLTLAWLMKQGNDVFPIPGTKKIKYLEQNWASLNVTLSDEEEAEIRAFSDASQIAGGLVPAQNEGMMFGDTVEESNHGGVYTISE